MPTNADLEVDRLLAQAGWLRSLAIALLGSPPDADDAVQEVWAAALRSPPDEARPPRPWLAQVLRNVVRSAARRRRSERERDRQAVELTPASTEAPAEGVLARMEIQRQVAALVMALDEPYRSTLLLRYYEGRQAVDIARAQEVPPGTVRWRINEGLRRLRSQLDDASQGDRDRWSRALVPIAGLPRGRAWKAVPLGLEAAAVVVVLAGGAAWLVHTHRPPGGGPGHGGPSVSHQLGFGHDGRKEIEKEDPQMKRERLKRAAVFLGVVLPSLAAGAAEAAQDAALEQAVVDACVELHERMYECRDPYIDAMIDLHLGGKRISPEEKAKLREHLMQGLTETATGPLEKRQARCKSMLSQAGERHRKVAEARWPSLRACYKEQDCQARVACMKPIFEELLGTEFKAQRKK
jgi:RNA polymerase sigma factor (sigma-70 family)